MLTKREMDTKVCSKCKEVKPLEEFYKNKSSRDGYQYQCKYCAKDYQTEYNADNCEKIRGRSARYYAANPEKKKEVQAKYYTANSEKIKMTSSEYKKANFEKERKRLAQYHKSNPEKSRARSSNRRAAKLKAIPKWLTKDDWQSMESIGEEADRLTRETGIKYEVDHIHPLQGKLICGLQCPTNLQILTKSQNCSKGNRFTPYVESES